MKTILFFALALIWCSGVLAQEVSGDREQTQEAGNEKSSTVPSTIDFQGRLHDSGGNPVNATLSITFSLYDVLSGGTAMWTETKSVQIVDGLFQVKLGETNPVDPGHFSDPDRWLGIKVGTDAEMSPRTKISSVGYALQSEGSSNFWTKSGNDIYYDAGNIGIGTDSPTAKLEVAGGDAIINELTVGKGGGSHLSNAVFGYSALASNTTGTFNTAVGNAPLFNNQSGEKNSAFGFRALFSNTTGSSNVAIGVGALYNSSDRSNLVAIGDSALYNNGQGATGYFQASGNTAIGSKALYSNTIGFYNTATGQNALYSNTTGNWNTASGSRALYSNTTGILNTASGASALYSNTTGYENTAVGYNALSDNTTGFENTAIGSLVLHSNTTGSFNTASGTYALYSNTTGSFNFASGTYALYSNTEGSQNSATGNNSLFANISGNNNVANGEGALFSNTTGSNNTALGQYSLPNNETGDGNTSVGQHSMASNSTGNYNTALGNYALTNNTTAYANVAIGAKTLYNNTDRSNLVAVGDSALYNNGQGATNSFHASGNTAIGSKALFSNTTGHSNTANGMNTLFNNTTGSKNTAIGFQSGNTVDILLTGEKNTFIGSHAGYLDGSIVNSTAIGADVTLTHSNTLILGNNANVGIGTSNPTQKLDVDGHVRIRGGSPGAGKVLTSDANGNASWDSPNTGPWQTSSDNNIYYNEGNVGIGVSNPTYKLEINGNTHSYIKFFNNTSGTGVEDGFIIGTTPSGSPVWIWNYENSNIHFGINNTNRMVILADGKINMYGSLNLNEGVPSAVALRCNGAETIMYNGTYFSFGFGNAGNYSVFGRKVSIGTTNDPGTHHLVVNGTAAKPGGGSWAVWSDIRLKNLHGTYEKGLGELLALQPVRYAYKEENPLGLPSDKEYVGLIAQDVENVFPEAVSLGQNGFLQIDIHPVNVAMINAIKELKAENDRLKAENEKLRQTDSKLNARLERLEKTLESMAGQMP